MPTTNGLSARAQMANRGATSSAVILQRDAQARPRCCFYYELLYTRIERVHAEGAFENSVAILVPRRRAPRGPRRTSHAESLRTKRLRKMRRRRTPAAVRIAGDERLQ